MTSFIIIRKKTDCKRIIVFLVKKVDNDNKGKLVQSIYMVKIDEDKGNVMDKVLMKAAFKAMLESSTDMVFLKDANLVYQAASMPFVKMVGKSSAQEIIGHTDLEIFEDENLAKRYVADDHKLMEDGENLVDYMEPITDDNGHARYGSTSKYILRDNDGQLIGLLGITRDITREYFARQRYQQELKYLFKLPADTYAVCYIDVDSWRVISQRRQEIGKGTLQVCQTVEELCEAALDSIVNKQCDAAEFYRNFTAAKLWSIYASGRSNMTFKYERKLTDGSKRWVRNEIRFLMDVDSGHLCAMLSAKDIDAIKQAEQRLVVAARLDQMTMLLNRETSMEYIRQVLSNESDRLHVLFMLDIDNFKGLNDTYGHQIGDEFLIELAKELKHIFRESDVVGRIGGDEFFALMRNVSEITQVEKKAQELLDIILKIGAPYPEIKVSGSIGISLYPGNGRTLEEMYAKADDALYEAKRGGKNRYVFAK